MSTENNNKLLWYNVALLGFVGIWGFGNVVNNYANQGLEVIFSWIFMMIFYFLPYILMVGELGSAFSNSSSGVSSWIKETSNAKLAYLAAWTYWVVHIPYIAQKPQSGLVALNWAFTMDPSYIDQMNVLLLQFIIWLIFIGFVYLASKGLKSLKILGSIAGSIIFVMGLLYVILGVSAVIFLDAPVATQNITVDTFIPTINFQYLTTISMLVFAVGGIEKLSPYVKETENAGKNFPKAMIAVAIMVIISAIAGSLTMGAMFDSNNIPEDLKLNGQYYAFQMLGQWWGLGDIFARIYALANAAGQFTALFIAIDAPLKILVLDSDSRYVPKALTKTNKHGAPINGYKMMAVLVSILIFIPALGFGNTNAIYNWLLDLNSIVMPMRYLWVFAAYFLLKRHFNDYNPEYVFMKNATLGKVTAIWCFAFTAFACILGMVPASEAGTSAYAFELTVNILAPVIFIGLGFILPVFAKRSK